LHFEFEMLGEFRKRSGFRQPCGVGLKWHLQVG
jgi:hypothetical protein